MLLLVLVAVLINRAWTFVTGDGYLGQFMLHVAFDLELPQVPSHREAIMGEALTLAQQQMAALIGWMKRRDHNIVNVIPGRIVETTYVNIDPPLCTRYYNMPAEIRPVGPRHGI